MSAPVKPMLDDLELPLVQRIETEEAQLLVDHAVPGFEGDFLQSLGRGATRVRLSGVFTGSQARDALEALRDRFHAGRPLPFVADILSATRVQRVLLADLEVEELSGLSERFAYRVTLDEYVEPPADPEAQAALVDDGAVGEAAALQESALDQVSGARGALEVVVDLGDSGADLERLRVRVEGRTEEGGDFATILEEHTGGVFRSEDVPAGDYTVTLVRKE